MVTSLFADVSGFTTLADMLEPEELHEVIAPVISGLAEIAERYEGFIAKYAGDALLVFFGAPVAHEDDAERAVRVALEMHSALPSFAVQLPEGAKDLTLHIGINTGRVVAGRFGGDARSDYSILGDAVIVAQRLESVAGSGDTYVGESTYELTKDKFRYESLGEMQLKGKLRAVPAWRLLGTRKSVAISGEGLDRPAFPLVGREEEMAEVWSVLDRLGGGHGGVVTIRAEPGVGKSRLLREIREQASDAGVRWYQGRSVSYGGGIAYHPWTDLIRQVARIRPEDDLALASERLDAALEGASEAREPFAVLLGLAGHNEVTHPEAFRQALRRGVVTWLRALESRGPIVLAFEDFHWADASSVGLLTDLQGAMADSGVLFLVTARPEGRDVLEKIQRAAGHARALDLQPLAPGAIRELVGHALGGVAPIELLATATERSGGNPLFVAEIVRALQDGGDIVKVGGRWRMRPGWDASHVPDSVERVLASRIDLLPPDETNVIQLAAVVGRVVPLRVADRLVREIEGGRAALERLVARRLLERTIWVGEDAVMFSHALVQEVAYARLLKRHRKELHRHVAETIELEWGTGDDVIDLLARHLYLGDAGDAAVDALVRAAARARRLYANEEAIGHLRRAAELTGDDRTDILLDLAKLEETVGHLDRAAALYGVLRARSVIAAWSGLSSILRKQGDYRSASAVAGDGLEHAQTDTERALLLLERARALGGGDDTHEAIACLRSGVAIAENSDPSLRGELLVTLARHEQMTGALRAAVEHATEALTLFQQADDLHRTASALRILGGIHYVMGEHGQATAVLRRAIEIAQRVGDVEEVAASLLNLALSLQAVGDLDESIKANNEAMTLFDAVGLRGGQLAAMNNLALALLLDGKATEAREVCERCIALAEEVDYAALVAEALDTLVAVLIELRDFAGAALAATRAAEGFAAAGDVSRAADLLTATASRVRHDARDRAEALTAFARSLEVAST